MSEAVFEAELLRLGERAARWFADGTRTDEPLDVEAAIRCLDGALGALEATDDLLYLTDCLRLRFGVNANRAADEGFSEEIIAEIVKCVAGAK